MSPEFATALVKAQSEIEGAKKKNSNPAFRSKYADLGACWEACREALHDNHIAVLQFPTSSSPGSVGLVTTLVYGPTGETLSESFALPLKDASSAQSAGSAITYARRYALCAVIGICPVDDDGNAASGVDTPGGNPFGHKSRVSFSPKDLIDRFAGTSDIHVMKSIYSELKNSTMVEPGKTELLTKCAARIKKESVNA